MFLLDTNVVSEFRRSRPHGGVTEWVRSTPAHYVNISAATFGEIRTGAILTLRHNEAKADEIESWARAILLSYTVLSMDAQTFEIWAELMDGKSDSLYEDAMIAATALQHDLTVVTRNVRDFSFFPVSVVNPFTTLN